VASTSSVTIIVPVGLATTWIGWSRYAVSTITFWLTIAPVVASKAHTVWRSESGQRRTGVPPPGRASVRAAMVVASMGIRV